MNEHTHLLLNYASFNAVISVEFCNSLFYGLPKYSIHRLQKVQNAVARIVTNFSHFSHTTPTLKSLHRLSIFYRNNFKIYCITHHALFLDEPFYLSTLLTHRSNTQSLRTTSFNPLLLPYFNKKNEWLSYLLICCTISLESFT